MHYPSYNLVHLLCTYTWAHKHTHRHYKDTHACAQTHTENGMAFLHRVVPLPLIHNLNTREINSPCDRYQSWCHSWEEPGTETWGRQKQSIAQTLPLHCRDKKKPWTNHEKAHIPITWFRVISYYKWIYVSYTFYLNLYLNRIIAFVHILSNTILLWKYRWRKLEY